MNCNQLAWATNGPPHSSGINGERHAMEMQRPVQDDSNPLQVRGRFQAALEDLGRLHEEELSVLRLKVLQLESQLGQSLPHCPKSELPGAEDLPTYYSSEPKKLEERKAQHQLEPFLVQSEEKSRTDEHVQQKELKAAGVSSSQELSAAHLMLASCHANLAPRKSDPSHVVARGFAPPSISAALQAIGGKNGKKTDADKWFQLVDGAPQIKRMSVLSGMPSSGITSSGITSSLASTCFTSGSNSLSPSRVSAAESAFGSPLESGRKQVSKPVRESHQSKVRESHQSKLSAGQSGELSRVASLRSHNGDGQMKRPSRGSYLEESSFMDFNNRANKSTAAGPIAHWERFVQQATHQAYLNLTELQDIWVRTDCWVRQIRWNNPGVDLWELGNNQDLFKLNGRSETRKALFDGDHDVDVHWEEEPFMKRVTLINSIRERTLISFIESNIVLDPQSRLRISWALIGVLLMLYDLVMLPMQAFELPENALSTFVAWFSQIFWSLDIVLSFLTGVYINTELVTRLAAIAKAYAKGWLLFDVLVVGPLWMVMVIGADSSTMNSLQAFKYVRMLRFLRLLRLAKFSRMLGEALAGINSPVIMLILGMAKLMGSLAILSHVNACLWYAAGQASDTGWTQSFLRDSTLYQYLAAMHWALTQFQGTSEITAGGSTGERAYAVVTVLLSMLILSTFVSSLTNMMMQLQALHDERTWQHRAVKSYLSSHCISGQLSTRVKKYIEWKQKYHRNHAEDEEVLKLMTIQLQMDLQDEVRGPVLTGHKYFRLFRFIYPRLTRRINHQAVQELHPAPDELIFSAQESSSRMYFVRTGELRYTIVRRKTCNTIVRMKEEVVDEEQYLSEAALWMHWQHRGDLVVIHFASLLTIVAQQFQTLVLTHPPALASCILYARRYIDAMHSVEWWSITDCVRPETLISDNAPLLEGGTQENVPTKAEEREAKGARPTTRGSIESG